MILVTGGRGFVGRRLIQQLLASNIGVISLVRSESKDLASFEVRIPKELSLDSLIEACSKYTETLDAIVHCAGLAHGKIKNATYQDYEASNVVFTELLARVADRLQVSKFIFLSTIGVFGRASESAISEESPVRPYDDYTRSKLIAEQRLSCLLHKGRSRLVIIRPPLIAGEQAPGNLGKLVRICASRFPLPFGLIKNRRSVLSLDNLVHFIQFTLKNEKVSGSFTLADDEVLSTKEIAIAIGEGVCKRGLLLPIPIGLIKVVSKLLGRKHIYDQLCGNLVVINSKAKALGWTPVVSTKQTLRNTGRFYALKGR